jgi:ankyrin repeat protein
VIYTNIEIAKILINSGAEMYIQQPSMRDLSPFFIAVKQEKIWAVELFVDAGAKLDIPSEEGYIPLFYATKFGYDDIAMYLSLRCNQDRFEDMNGDTIFMQYMRKKDYNRLQMLLRRGSNINYQT